MDLSYEGVGFNIESIIAFKNADALCSHKSYQHLWPGVSDTIRKQRLKEVYGLCKQLKVKDANNR